MPGPNSIPEGEPKLFSPQQLWVRVVDCPPTVRHRCDPPWLALPNRENREVWKASKVCQGLQGPLGASLLLARITASVNALNVAIHPVPVRSRLAIVTIFRHTWK